MKIMFQCEFGRRGEDINVQAIAMEMKIKGNVNKEEGKFGKLKQKTWAKNSQILKINPKNYLDFIVIKEMQMLMPTRYVFSILKIGKDIFK